MIPQLEVPEIDQVVLVRKSFAVRFHPRGEWVGIVRFTIPAGEMPDLAKLAPLFMAGSAQRTRRPPVKRSKYLRIIIETKRGTHRIFPVGSSDFCVYQGCTTDLHPSLIKEL